MSNTESETLKKAVRQMFFRNMLEKVMVRLVLDDTIPMKRYRRRYVIKWIAIRLDKPF